jgi:hypothetical protein
MSATLLRSPRTVGAFSSPLFPMNAPQFDSPDGARSLSVHVEAQLSAALVAHAKQPTPETAQSLKSALEVAAREARERELRSEELLLVFKAIERTSGVMLADEKAAASRNQLIKSLLEAYYLSDRREG